MSLRSRIALMLEKYLVVYRVLSRRFRGIYCLNLRYRFIYKHPIYLSLGNSCRTRFQIDRHSRIISPNYKPGFYFFDRLMAGNLPGVINLIERDFVLREGDLEVYELNGRYRPRDRQSGMVFLHDFGSHGDFWDSHTECIIAMTKGMEASLALYDRLRVATISLLKSKGNVILIYHGPASAEDFSYLKKLLKYKYGRNFRIVNILEAGQPPTAHRRSAVTRYVRDSESHKRGGPAEWEGCDDSWARAMYSIESFNVRFFRMLFHKRVFNTWRALFACR